ncbi:MAG: flavodoxin-dependent (E)-4-hydroxy-3-methylbut-2-enyl-diphosphate synthase [Planctomycetota bacterium]
MQRRKTIGVKIGSVEIGSDFPISIQSMIKIDTMDIAAVLRQIRRLVKEGCEIIRIAVPSLSAVKALKQIVQNSQQAPIEADTHFSTDIAIATVKAGVNAVRINPGNMHNTSGIKLLAKYAKERQIPIRVGVNSGSVNKSGKDDSALTLAQTALNCCKLLESADFNDIMISVKAASVRKTIEAYRIVADSCNYPLHLGVTATGTGMSATIKSAIGIGALLIDGIGDTIRVSLTGNPVNEVIAAKKILQSVEARCFEPEIISCPTCGRCEVDLYKIVKNLAKELTNLPQNLKIAVMGCIVNGPGEAKEADIGIAYSKKIAYIFKNGRKIKKVNPENAAAEIINELKKQ